MKFHGGSVPAAALVLSLISTASFAQVKDAGMGPHVPAYVPGQALVQFHSTATASRVSYALARSSVTVMERIPLAGHSGKGKSELLVVQTGKDVLGAVDRLEKDPNVAFAEPNWVRYPRETPNDSLYLNGNLWGMYGAGTFMANPFGSRAGDVWETGSLGSRSVYVGVIDEGVQFDHPDLAANVWTNPFDPVDGVDNDHNGYVDDVHGWDFVNNDSSVYDGGPSGAQDSHGTHVAGTIGAVGGNGIGVVGINWKVQIISGKILPGGSAGASVKAIDYFTRLKLMHNINIVATNNSWGGGPASQAEHDAVIRAAKANILFIAAAGNNSKDNDAEPDYPSNYRTDEDTSTESAAGYDAVISVAAIDKAGNLATFSHFGATTVDLAAPGTAIYSTYPYNRYQTSDGTSMAAPHVAGAAALYASMHPEIYRAAATPQGPAKAIRDALLNSVLPTPSLNGKTVTGGRLNLALLAAPNAAVLRLQAAAVDDADGNGNGRVDPNECLALNLTLSNPGGGVATGVTGRLTSEDPNVRITQAKSAYPNLNTGGAAANATPFRLTLRPGFNCGRAAILALKVTTDGGTFSIPVQVMVGNPNGPVQVFNSAGNPVAIPDKDPNLDPDESNPLNASMPVTVAGVSGAVSKVKVSVHLKHPAVDELILDLIAPDGTVVRLAERNMAGGADYGTDSPAGDNDTTFDDAAAQAITQGTAPFVGSFRPEGSLSAFIGKSGGALNGNWTLRVSDESANNVGSIESWSLSVQTPACQAGAGCNEANVNSSLFDFQTVPNVMQRGWRYTVGVTLTNNGQTTWSRAGNYELDVQNPAGNTTWKVNRIPLPPGVSVSPGESHTFTFQVTAPDTVGTYNFQWRMLQRGSGAFGATTPNVAVDVVDESKAQFISQAVPATMQKEGRYLVSVTMRNTGASSWFRAAGFGLSSQNPQGNKTWAVNFVGLPPGVTVNPGGQHTFTFPVTAPDTVGTYNFQWRMVRAGEGWFGDLSPNVAVNVTASNNAQYVSQTVPATLTPGQAVNSVTVTVRNNGTTTWTRAAGYGLLSQNPQGNTRWGVNLVRLPAGVTVAPGEQFAFTFPIAAPNDPGVYRFRWRMVQVGVGVFGSLSPNTEVTVQ